MKKKAKENVVATFATIGIFIVIAFIMFICVHVSLTMHYTAVRAARNDRAINGIIAELGGRRAWTDGSYIEEPECQMIDWGSLEWAPSAFTVGKVTIHGSGEVDYPGDVSEATKEFWEAVIEAFPGIDWGP